MGYTTDFAGSFQLDKTLSVEHQRTLVEFSQERHGGNADVYDGFPGFWCQWVPTPDGTGIEWDGGEKFYNYTEWLEYIIKNFLEPWGYKLNGKVKWFGEDNEDMGIIVVENNTVKAKEATITFEEE